MVALTATQKFTYITLARLVFALHFALVLVVSVGWLIPGLFYVYLFAFIATLYSELFLGYCPLTRLEFSLRKKVNPNLVFDKSCIVHYVRALFGLKPREAGTAPKTFFKKYSFIFVLSGIFAVSIIFKIFV